MIRTIAAVGLLALAAVMPAHDASAQNNALGGALLGAGAGAIIGGAAGGGRGAAIGAGVGAATGAIIGSQMEPRRGGYYWYDGRCYARYPNGEYYRVSQRYCY
jgi:uncharacterized protein YcfJ